jgi:hypothetical protein
MPAIPAGAPHIAQMSQPVLQLDLDRNSVNTLDA